MSRTTFSGQAYSEPAPSQSAPSMTGWLSELLGLSGLVATLAVWGILAQGLGL